MSTTKYKISEQVWLKLKQNPSFDGSSVKMNAIKLLVGQVCNALLKADYFQVSTPEGDTIPNNCMIFTYGAGDADGIDVTTYKTTKSIATLPFTPISLPKNMGVFYVAPVDDIDNPYIPIPAGMYGIISPVEVLGALSGLVGYEVVGNKLIFTSDITALGVTKLYIRLVGVDVDNLTDFDVLPVSADLEIKVVEAVYNMIVGEVKQ